MSAETTSTGEAVRSSATAGIEILSPVRAVEFEDAWYDAATADHFWMEWRRRELVRFIDQCGLDRGDSLDALEIGGGHGVARRQLERCTRWQIDLTDLNMQSLQRGLAASGRTMYYDVTDRAPSLRERYGVVLLLDVLEHVDRASSFLDAVVWHLKPGGLLVINVPALPSFYSAYDEVLGHCRRYTKASLRSACEGAGLSGHAIRFWGMSLLPLLAARAAFMRHLPTDPDGRARIAQQGMQPPNAAIDAVLRVLMRVELSAVSNAPVGSSLLCAARKASQ